RIDDEPPLPRAPEQLLDEPDAGGAVDALDVERDAAEPARPGGRQLGDDGLEPLAIGALAGKIGDRHAAVATKVVVAVETLAMEERPPRATAGAAELVVAGGRSAVATGSDEALGREADHWRAYEQASCPPRAGYLPASERKFCEESDRWAQDVR